MPSGSSCRPGFTIVFTPRVRYRRGVCLETLTDVWLSNKFESSKIVFGPWDGGNNLPKGADWEGIGKAGVGDDDHTAVGVGIDMVAPARSLQNISISLQNASNVSGRQIPGYVQILTTTAGDSVSA